MSWKLEDGAVVEWVRDMRVGVGDSLSVEEKAMNRVVGDRVKGSGYPGAMELPHVCLDILRKEWCWWFIHGLTPI